MPMSERIPLLRIATEGVAIVASILLAFAIDAWWQHRVELERADALVVSLSSDFGASQTHLDIWLAGTRRVLDASTELLRRIRGTERDELLVVPMELVVGAISAPTYTPTDATLEAAFSSGDIDLIGDNALRSMLTLWRQQMADTTEDELLVREIVVSQLVPELSSQVRLGDAFDFERLTGWFFGRSEFQNDEPVKLRASSVLEGALAERVFYSNFIVGGLAEIYETQAEVLRLLDAHIDH